MLLVMNEVLIHRHCTNFLHPKFFERNQSYTLPVIKLFCSNSDSKTSIIPQQSSDFDFDVVRRPFQLQIEFHPFLRETVYTIQKRMFLITSLYACSNVSKIFLSFNKSLILTLCSKYSLPGFMTSYSNIAIGTAQQLCSR